MMGSGTAAAGNAPRRHRVLWIGLAVIVIGAIGWWGYRAGGDNVPALEPSRPDKIAVAATPAAAEKSASMAPTPEGSRANESQPSQDRVAGVPPRPVASVPAKSHTRPAPSSDPPAKAERTKTNRISPEPLSVKPSAGNTDRKPIPSIARTEASRPQEPHAQPHPSATAAMTPQAASIEAAEKPPSPSGAKATASQSRRRNPPPTPPPPQALPARSPYANAAPLVSDTLQVQAISWSDQPAKRIAVIDGRILREGQRVNAYQVIQIRPEDVILEKSGKFWKLAFGSR